MPPTSEQLRQRAQVLRQEYDDRQGYKLPRQKQEDDWRTDLGRVYEVDDSRAALTDIEVWDFARMIANTPGSLARNIGILGEAVVGVFNPDMEENTVANLGKMALSGLHAGARAVLGDGIGSEEDEQVFWNVMGELKKRYGSHLRKTLVEDPGGILMDVAGLFTGGGGALARFGGKAATVGNKVAQIGKALDKVSPPSLAAGAFKGAARGGMALGKAGLPEIASLSTGIEPTALRGMVSATANPRVAQGLTSREAAVNTMRKKLRDPSGEWQRVSGADIAFHIHDELKRARGLVSDRNFDVSIKPYRKMAVDVQGARQDMLSFLKEEWSMAPRKDDMTGAYRRAPSGNADYPRGIIVLDYIGEGSGADKLGKLGRAPIEKAFTKYYDMDRWGETTKLGQLHDTMQFVDNRIKPPGEKFKVVRGVLDKMRDKARDRFPEKAQTVLEEYRRETTLLEDFPMVLQAEPMRQGSFKDVAATMNHFNQTMREGVSPEIMREFLEIAEKRGDAFFNGPAAGNALREWMPSGIHARNIALSAMGTSGILGIIGFGAPAFLPLLAFPFTMPRLVGEAMSLLGAGVKVGNKVEEWVDRLHVLAARHLPPEAAATANIGTAVERLLEAGIEVPQPPRELHDPIRRQGARRSPPAAQVLMKNFMR